MINERNGLVSSTVERRCDASYGRVSDISGSGHSSRREAFRAVTDRRFPAALRLSAFACQPTSGRPDVPGHSRGARLIGTCIPRAVRRIGRLCNEARRSGSERGACEPERAALSVPGKHGTTGPRCDRRRVHGQPHWAVISPYECGPTR